MNKEDNYMYTLGGCLGWLVLGFATFAFSGFVTQDLWNGLIATTFKISELSYWQAIGLDLFVSYLTFTSKSNDEKSAKETFASAIIATLLFWGAGALVTIFI